MNMLERLVDSANAYLDGCLTREEFQIRVVNDLANLTALNNDSALKLATALSKLEPVTP